MATECEYVEALLTATGARFVWGHSSGAFVALRAALTAPQIRKVVLYEPPLSEHGSISTSWIPRFDREVARGKPASALVTFVEADNLVPTYLPRWLLVPLIGLYLRWEKRTVEPSYVPMEDPIPLQRLDGLLVREMDSSLGTLAGIRAEVLLMGGQKSTAFLGGILDALEETLPRVELPGAATPSASVRSCGCSSPVRTYSRTGGETGKHGRRQSYRVHTAPLGASALSH